MRPILIRISFMTLFLVLFLSSFAIARDKDDRYLVPACGGFTTGNDYRNLSEMEQLAYVKGAFDAIMIIPRGDALNKNNRIMRIVARTEGLQIGQLRAVVNKYLDEHPEDWHMPMGLLFYGAVSNAFDPPSGQNR
jgi:Rap1a immunity proteins